jgi:hypothetical protein
MTHSRRSINVANTQHRIVSGGFRFPRKMVSSASSLPENGFFSEEDCFYAALGALLAGMNRMGTGQNPLEAIGRGPLGRPVDEEQLK